MSTNSTFKTDLEKEQQLGVLLDTLYASFSKRMGLIISRNENVDLQYKGVDLLITFKDKTYKIDEKAKIRYINDDNESPTFVFEISYLKNTVLKTGWFVDESKETDYYFLITNIKSEDGSIEKITKFDLTSVSRTRLKRYLSQNNWPIDTIISKSIQMRKNTILDCQMPGIGKIAFSPVSRKTGNVIPEAPINLVLNLNTLISKGVAKRINLFD